MKAKEHKEVLETFSALIAQAWGWDKDVGNAVSHDPALARELEWLRDSYLELAKNVKFE